MSNFKLDELLFGCLVTNCDLGSLHCLLSVKTQECDIKCKWRSTKVVIHFQKRLQPNSHVRELASGSSSYKLTPALPSCVSGSGGGCVRGCGRRLVVGECCCRGSVASHSHPRHTPSRYPDTPQHSAG